MSHSVSVIISSRWPLTSRLNKQRVTTEMKTNDEMRWERFPLSELHKSCLCYCKHAAHIPVKHAHMWQFRATVLCPPIQKAAVPISALHLMAPFPAILCLLSTWRNNQSTRITSNTSVGVLTRGQEYYYWPTFNMGNSKEKRFVRDSFPFLHRKTETFFYIW